MHVDSSNYQSLTNETAIYPKNLARPYLCLGLSGEAGELCDKVKKIVRDSHLSFDEAVKEKRLEIGKEVGDMFWYVAQICEQLIVTPFDDIKNWPNIYDDRHILSLTQDIAFHAVLISHNLSIGSGNADQPRKQVIFMTSVMVSMCRALLKKLDMTFEDALQMNIDKLFSRKERGALGGSGDDR